MDVLRIDHDKLDRKEALLYRELQGVCSLCLNKRECALDLAGGFDGMRWDKWWLYCPNSAMLTTIGALQKCGRSANRTQLAAQPSAGGLNILAEQYLKKTAPMAKHGCRHAGCQRISPDAASRTAAIESYKVGNVAVCA